jgi:hypothetical protein
VLDLYRFEPWFDALSADGVESALRIVHSPPDDLTLMRTLWFLAHSTVNLAQSDRDRILILAQSQNPGVRSMAMRFACAGSDETLRKCIVDLGSSFHNRGGDSAVVFDYILLTQVMPWSNEICALRRSVSMQGCLITSTSQSWVLLIPLY